jgi:DNA invertase Pin-like site-specific DNA recombinase
MQPKIYAYIRISKDTSDAENQRHEILSHYNNKVSPEWVEEVVTGNSNADDRKLGELIERLQAGDTLVVADVSRLGRRSLDVMETGARVVKKKARLIACKSNLELKDDIGSEVMFFALSLAARIEREMISERTKAALNRKRSEGMVLGRPKGSTSLNKTLLENEADVRRLVAAGVSVSAIGRAYKLNRRTVTVFLKVKGLKVE